MTSGVLSAGTTSSRRARVMEDGRDGMPEQSPENSKMRVCECLLAGNMRRG